MPPYKFAFGSRSSPPMSEMGVRRDKAALSSGCKPHPKSIDVRRWHREGRLRAGQQFPWTWTCDGEPSGTIKVRTELEPQPTDSSSAPSRGSMMPTSEAPQNLQSSW